MQSKYLGVAANPLTTVYIMPVGNVGRGSRGTPQAMTFMRSCVWTSKFLFTLTSGREILLNNATEYFLPGPIIFIGLILVFV